MKSLRAVITGLGVVSPYGTGVEAFRAGIREGRSATRRVTLFDPGDLPCQVAAEVPDFDPAAHLPRANHSRVDASITRTGLHRVDTDSLRRR